MLRVSDSVIIARSPLEIFDLAADPYTQLKWDPGTLQSVEKLTPGPLERGARYRGNFKGFGVVEYEFVEYEPGKQFAHQASMNIGDIRHIFEFEPIREGTQLTQSLIVEPKGIAKLLGPIMRRMLRRRLREINSEIKGYVLTHMNASA